MKCIIIGGSHAGVAAARALKILVELINLLSLMIQTKMNIFDIIQSDFYFQPEFTSYARYLQQIALESLPAIG